MTAALPFDSRRSPVMGTKGMVAASQPLAVAAGLEMLRRGGNAVDAAVAAAAALNVTAPTSTGIGGDCFTLYYEAASRKVYALNGSGRAPQELTYDRLQREGFGEELPPYHPYTVTVPGACAAWCDLIERFGHLTLAEVLAPAIDLAEKGYPVAPLVAHGWAFGAKEQLATALNGRELTIDGRAPRAGEIFRNPGLARTFKAVAEGGKEVFYRGEIGAAVARTVQEAGGCLQESDLAVHESTWEEPIATVYRHLRLWECPPNGQGLVALLALNILSGFDLPALPPLSAQRLHLQVEALRLAFADAEQYLADPAFSHVPVEELLSAAYADQRRRAIDPRRANPWPRFGHPRGKDTVYLSVVDQDGNACSLINSNYMGFGTGIVPAGWGFTLHNRGLNFTLREGHANAPAPGKRPYHTIIPAMLTHAADDALFASLGVMGGFMQPQGHVQVVSGLVDDGLDPQRALDRSRFYLLGGHPHAPLALEEGISAETAARLAEMGHQTIMVSGHDREVFGRGQVIMRDKNSGVLTGGSDPRGDGCAMTL